MSKTKLDWEYQNSARTPEYRAAYKGLVIRAVHDDSPENPFESEDGHWPMLVRYDRTTTTYDKVPGLALGAVLGRFNDALLVHDQKAIGAAVKVQDCDFESHLGDDQIIRKWWTDAQLLRSAFEDALYDMPEERLDTLAELYAILGVPCLRHTSQGHCQGDWAELLIVATPEAQKALRSQPADMDAETWAATLKADMENQAKLYDAWAWGDVYGFSIHRPVEDEDDAWAFGDMIGDALDSCWGFYGSDFAWSGLEEAAIEAAEGFVEEAA